MNLDQEIHRESLVKFDSLFDKGEYFRLKVIELKEKRASQKLVDIEHEMVMLEELMDKASPESQVIYKTILDTLNKKFEKIDDQIIMLEEGSLDDEEDLLDEIEYNIASLENKIEVFTSFFDS